jgi:hypothetical protein
MHGHMKLKFIKQMSCVIVNINTYLRRNLTDGHQTSILKSYVSTNI